MADHNILNDLFRAAERFPQKTAAADKKTSLTYEALFRRAGSVAAALSERQAAGRPVGVLARRAAGTLPLLYGAAWAGGFYVPVDPEAPPEKKTAILADAGAGVLLGDAPRAEALAGIEYGGAYLEAGEIPDAPPPPLYPAEKDTPLYMVYTSGSTGKPKGVLKSHGAMESYLEAFLDAVDMGEDEIVGNQTPFCFDASAKDLYLTLRRGATLEILDTALFTLPMSLIAYLNERHVTWISWVPSALSVVTKLNTFSALLPQNLRKVLFVGEVFPMKQLNRWRKALPEVEFYNLYGQSELAGVCCLYPVTGEFSDTDTLPIGRPLKNSRVVLLREGAEVTAPGELGELCVSSPALALGYWRDPARTAERFIEWQGRRTFRTGDMAYYHENGDLVFAARADDQVKHMGYRIELGEIEAAAAALPGLQAVCCRHRKDRDQLILFCQPVPGQTVTPGEILSALKRRLSAYMTPNRVVLLDALPLNAHGKTDRQKLDRYFDTRSEKHG